MPRQSRKVASIPRRRSQTRQGSPSETRRRREDESEESGASARAFSSATITFGLVTVPVRLMSATRTSAGISFHLLHAKDHARVRQQLVCSEDGKVLLRAEIVKGYEYAKDRYVTFDDEELKALDQKATQGIEVAEFVPLETVDPVHYQKTYYLAPDRGGDRGYALLAAAMERRKLAAVAQYAARGKDYLMLLRAADGRLLAHQLFHADEVRKVSEVPRPKASAREAELKLAEQLLSQNVSAAFDPSKYQDQVRRRIREAIQAKVKGGEVAAAPAAAPAPAKVVDLMEVLKKSLGQRAPSSSAAGSARSRSVARRRAAS
jgi:DNA end-binding protein Ku